RKPAGRLGAGRTGRINPRPVPGVCGRRAERKEWPLGSLWSQKKGSSRQLGVARFTPRRCVPPQSFFQMAANRQKPRLVELRFSNEEHTLREIHIAYP